ncbi:MAG: DUF4397 domain-containing protein [Chloroflexi bacterium]|nr:DUF4397 domain-containing protein [Chloroflexota bacterium]
MRKFLTLLVVLVALALTSVGVFAQLEDPEPAADAAFVRIAHFSSGTAAVKAFVNGEARISGLAYGSVTRWLDLAPGSYEFAIGTTSDPAAAQISGISLDLAPGSFTTLAAVGSGDALQGLTIAQDYTRISTGQARATVINGIEGAGAPVNFSVGGGGFDFVAFPGSITSADGFASGEIAPGTGISISGVNNGVVYAEDAEREIAAGHNYLVVASGAADDVRLTVVDTDQADYSTANFAEVKRVCVSLTSRRPLLRSRSSSTASRRCRVCAMASSRATCRCSREPMKSPSAPTATSPTRSSGRLT